MQNKVTSEKGISYVATQFQQPDSGQHTKNARQNRKEEQHTQLKQNKK